MVRNQLVIVGSVKCEEQWCHILEAFENVLFSVNEELKQAIKFAEIQYLRSGSRMGVHSAVGHPLRCLRMAASRDKNITQSLSLKRLVF